MERAESPLGDRWRLDESQLRTALLQLDLAQSGDRASANNELAFHRADIAPTRGEFATMRLVHSWSDPSQTNPEFITLIQAPLELAANRGVVGGNPAEAKNETMSRWRLETSAGSAQHEIYSRLSLDKADPGHNGLYECEVAALEQANSAGGSAHLPDNLAAGNQAHLVLSGDKLRRVFGLLVNGKYKCRCYFSSPIRLRAPARADAGCRCNQEPSWR